MADRLTGHWSKYGGGRTVLSNLGEEWSCQSCATLVKSDEHKPHEVEFMPKEEIRVCDDCHITGFTLIEQRVGMIDSWEDGF